MPMMLLPAFLFVAVLGVAVAFFLQRGRLLRELLVTVARRAGGRVVKGPMGIYPLAEIPLEGEKLLLSGIQGGNYPSMRRPLPVKQGGGVLVGSSGAAEPCPSGSSTQPARSAGGLNRKLPRSAFH